MGWRAVSQSPIFGPQNCWSWEKAVWFKSHEILCLFQSLPLTTHTWESREYFSASVALPLKCVGNSFLSLTHKDIWRADEVGGKCSQKERRSISQSLFSSLNSKGYQLPSGVQRMGLVRHHITCFLGVLLPYHVALGES